MLSVVPAISFCNAISTLAWIPRSAQRAALFHFDIGSILGLIDKAVLLDPRHHVSQLCADYFHRVLGRNAPHRLHRRHAGTVLEDELLGELSALNLAEYLPHLGARLLVDDTRSASEIAILGRVGH